MSADWDFTDLNTLAADLGHVGARGARMAAVVVGKTAADVQRDAQAFCPVDTGNLRNSISRTVTGLTAEIGPTAAYGVYVEYGTSRHGPAAFMGPALDRHAPQFERAMTTIAEAALGERP